MLYVRSQIEKVLIRRCGRQMAYAKMDATTEDGTNVDLSDPIATGLGSLGYVPGDPSSVTDGDLSSVQSADFNQLLEVAEWRCLESVLGNRASPDQMADTDNQQWHGKFFEALDKRVARLRKQIEDQYGVGLSPLHVGVLDLGFAETVDPNTGRPI